MRWGRVTNRVIDVRGTLVPSANGTHHRGIVTSPHIMPIFMPLPRARKFHRDIY